MWAIQINPTPTYLARTLRSVLNVCQVVLCLFSLARITQLHPEYSGPRLGPKMAEKNERNFSEEQIRRNRDAVVGLQAGTNTGASQVLASFNNLTHRVLNCRPGTVGWGIPVTCNI